MTCCTPCCPLSTALCTTSCRPRPPTPYSSVMAFLVVLLSVWCLGGSLCCCWSCQASCCGCPPCTPVLLHPTPSYRPCCAYCNEGTVCGCVLCTAPWAAAASCTYTCCPLLSYVLHRTPWLLAYAACCYSPTSCCPTVPAVLPWLLHTLSWWHYVLLWYPTAVLLVLLSLLSCCGCTPVLVLSWPPCICTAHLLGLLVARILRLCTHSLVASTGVWHGLLMAWDMALTYCTSHSCYNGPHCARARCRLGSGVTMLSYARAITAPATCLV